MRIIGYVLLIVGGLVALASFGTDTAPEGTHNIGLMQGQMMLFQAGAVALIIGAIFASVASVVGRMEAAGLLPPAGVTVSSVRQGPSE